MLTSDPKRQIPPSPLTFPSLSATGHAKLWRTAGRLYAENLAKRTAGNLPADKFMLADIGLIMGFCNVMANFYEKESGQS